MPKFYVEAHNSYYPHGGMDDLTGPYDSEIEAKEQIGDTRWDSLWIIRVEHNVLTRIAIHSYRGWDSFSQHDVLNLTDIEVWLITKRLRRHKVR